MNDSKGHNFFAERWEVFVVAELCRELEDSDYLQKVQRNIVDAELRRIAAATEILVDGVPAKNGLETT